MGALERARIAAALGIGLALGTLLAAPAARAQDKAGPVMLNFKVGPSIAVSGNPDLGTQVALVLDAGFAVTPDRNGYVIFPLQFQLGGDVATVLMFPLGFEYDVALPAAPGLYLVPRLSLGYALGLPKSVFGFTPDKQHAFLVLPELGIKFVARGQFNVGFDAMSLAIGLGCDSCTEVSYRLLFYGGINF